MCIRDSRGTSAVQKNPLYLGLYISFFPQLVAGPIVRYNTIAAEIKNRKTTLDDFCSGFSRFIIGLGKKALLADQLALVADRAFTMQPYDLSIGFAWLGAIAFMLQIYYDFSGYSDMAIGLGRMFGFHFMENFQYPYIANSITDFWRRWHISLSSWLRDYIYIPLGGNRVKTKTRLFFNLFMVWLATGIWHGANWTFILWGLYYFVFIVIERLCGLNKKPLKIGGHIYTLLIVLFGWVIFRSADFRQLVGYCKSMLGLWPDRIFLNDYALFYFQEYGLVYLAAILCSIPWLSKYKEKICNHPLFAIPAALFLICIFVFSVSFIIKGNYNPFIYFNF